MTDRISDLELQILIDQQYETVQSYQSAAKSGGRDRFRDLRRQQDILTCLEELKGRRTQKTAPKLLPNEPPFFAFDL